jgi:hypothetical protein
VSDIDQYFGNGTCEKLPYHRTVFGKLSVTESAACSRQTQGSIMPTTQTDPLYSIADFGVFSCANCGKPMRLSCIEPAEPGFDVRTFECEKCNHTVKFAVSI